MRRIGSGIVGIVWLLTGSPATGGMWAPIGPGGGGPIQKVVADPLSASTVYVGSAGGVAKTTDGGITWTRANGGVPLSQLFVTSLAIDPTNSSRLFRGANSCAPTCFFRSVDGGAHWTAVLGTPFTFPSATAVDPTAPSVVYVGESAIYKSLDGGATFSTTAPLGPTTVSAISVDPAAPTSVLAGTFSGLFTSSDGGLSFTLRSSAIGDPSVYAVARNPFAPATIIAATGSGLYRSLDGGVTWSLLRASSHRGVVFDPVTSGTVYATQAGLNAVFKSTNGGTTWASVSTGFSIPGGALAIAPTSPTTLWAAPGLTFGTPTTREALFKTTTGGAAWFDTSTNLQALTITDLRFDPTGAALYAASRNGIQRSADGGTTWTDASSGLGRLDIVSLAVDPTAPSRLFAGTEGVGTTSLFRSVDGGTTWAASAAGLPAGKQVHAIAIDPLTPTRTYVATRSGGVYRTSDGGVSWAAANVGLTGLDVLEVQTDPLAPSTVYAGALGASVPLYRSTDAGASWSARSNGITSTTVYDIAPHPVMPGVVYAGTGAGVFRSVDGGGTWAASGTGLPGGAAVQSIAIDPADPAHVYAAVTGTGVFFSADDGATWGPINTGLETTQVGVLAVDPGAPGRVLAGTTGMSVFAGDFPGVCGNDRTEFGEQCDGGVCCTGACQFATPATVCRAAASPCDVAESCTGVDAACPADVVPGDGDGDGLCDALDPCTTTVLAEAPRLKVTRLVAPSGDEGLKLAGTMTVPTTPPVNPVQHGLRVVIQDALDTILLDETLPAGPFELLSAAGWRVNGSSTAFTYLSKRGATIITKASLTGPVATPGRYKFTVQAKRGAFAVSPGALPLRASVVLDPPTADTGQCGELRFPGPPPAPTCVVAPSGATLNCR